MMMGNDDSISVCERAAMIDTAFGVCIAYTIVPPCIPTQKENAERQYEQQLSVCPSEPNLRMFEA